MSVVHTYAMAKTESEQWHAQDAKARASTREFATHDAAKIRALQCRIIDCEGRHVESFTLAHQE